MPYGVARCSEANRLERLEEIIFLGNRNSKQVYDGLCSVASFVTSNEQFFKTMCTGTLHPLDYFFLVNLSTFILSLLCIIISVCTYLHLLPTVVPSGVHTLLLHSSPEPLFPRAPAYWAKMGKCSGLVFDAALDLYSVNVIFETLAFYTSRKLKIFKTDKAVSIFLFYNFGLETNYVLLTFWELNC